VTKAAAYQAKIGDITFWVSNEAVENEIKRLCNRFLSNAAQNTFLNSLNQQSSKDNPLTTEKVRSCYADARSSDYLKLGDYELYFDNVDQGNNARDLYNSGFLTSKGQNAFAEQLANMQSKGGSIDVEKAYNLARIEDGIAFIEGRGELYFEIKAGREAIKYYNELGGRDSSLALKFANSLYDIASCKPKYGPNNPLTSNDVENAKP
ncbi:MAG: hypothetical protein QXL47_03115, partial [Candidatus Anstonellales archaeon]